MRNIVILKQGLKATNAFYERPAKDEYNEVEEIEARFCLEHCPHKKCKGICEDFKHFKNSLIDDKREVRERKVKTPAEKIKQP